MIKLGESGKTVQSEHFLDETEGTVHVKYQADVESVLQSNKEAQNNFSGFGKGTFHHVAEIPAIMAVKWLAEEGINIYTPEGFDYVIKKKLNNPEFQYLKTIPGAI